MSILPKAFFAAAKRLYDFRFLGDVALYGNGLSAAFCDFVHDLVGAFLAGGIIDDHGRAFGREMFSDVGADSLRCARYDGDFSCEFFVFIFIPFVVEI